MSERQSYIIGGILILGAAIAMTQMLLGNWALDLTALYFAGHFFAEGQFDMVYLPGPEVSLFDPPEAWAALALAEGAPETYLTPYLYPPLWAALLAPLTRVVSAQGFYDAVLIVNLTSLAAMIWLAFSMTRAEGRLGFASWAGLSLALLVATSPGVLGIWLGQPQILVSALTLGAFFALMRGRDMSAGAMLGLAAAIKLTPAFLVLIFVMERRWKALGAFALVGGALAIASVALAGWPLHEAFLHKLGEVEGQVLYSRIVASLELGLYHLGAALSGDAIWSLAVPWQEPQPVWVGWAVRAVLAGGFFAIWATTRGLDPARRIWARLFAALMLTLVTNPLAWTHYLILPLLMLPGLTAFLPQNRAITVTALFALILSQPVFLWLAEYPALGLPQAALHLAVVLGLLALPLVLAVRARP